MLVRAFEARFVHMLEGSVSRRKIYRSILLAGIAVYQAVETYDAALAGVADHFDLLFISWLEAYCGRCRNIQVTTECRLAVELQVAVCLEKVEVRAHLNRAVACVAHGYGYGATLQVVGYILVA